jgi:V8-like Glu-specific endopeptidase
MNNTIDKAKHLVQNTFNQINTYPASEGNLSQITHSIFVTGNEKTPNINTKIVPLKSVKNGHELLNYEIRIEINGVYLGERTTPPSIDGKAITKQISKDELEKYDKLFTPFIPKHLPFVPSPQKLLEPYKRIPDKLDKNIRYYTTIFAPDERQVFKDTSYPWSAFGRCETNHGPFSGVMIGPRHLLTCNHGINWNAPPDYAADWLKFTPSYFDGDAPFGTTYANYIYWIEKVDSDGLSDGDEGGVSVTDKARYDYVVLVLNDDIGNKTGWLGTRPYIDNWDFLDAWWHIGYPLDLTGMQRPVFQKWFSMDGDDNQEDSHQVIRHKADVYPGQSGGPMFGFWNGDIGPRAVATQSWQSDETNGASGGEYLDNLVIQARIEHP